MDTGKYTDEYLDKFINNEMQDAEKETFCRALERSPDLQSRVRLRQLIHESIQEEAKEQEITATLHRKNKKLHYKIGMGIILALILAFCVGNSPVYNTQDIYTEYFFLPYFDYSQSHDELTAGDILVNNELIVLYEQKAYAEMLSFYQERWSNKTADELPTATLLCLSVSALNVEQFPLAISILEQLKNPDYQEKIDWLLLCCHLKENNRSKALELARQIAIKGDRLSEKTYEIEKKLKKRRWF